MAFYLAGIPPLVGGAMLCLIPWVERRRKAREAAAAATPRQGFMAVLPSHHIPPVGLQDYTGDEQPRRSLIPAA